MTRAKSRETDILTEIEKDLELFDRILLMADRYVEPFLDSNEKKILVLSVDSFPVKGNQQIVHKKITQKQQSELLDIYGLYKFSDRFRIVSADDRFGSLWNYVDTGIISMREMWEALVH